MSAFPKARSSIATQSARRLAMRLILGATAAVAPVGSTESRAELRSEMQAASQPAAHARAAVIEMSRVPYQARLATSCTSGGSRCDFTSAVIWSGRRLEIHRLACRGEHSPPGDLPPEFETFAYAERGSSGAALLVHLPEARYSRTSTRGIWTINEQVLMFIPAGYRLHMYNSATTGVLRSVGCTISGYLVMLGT
jgi:hypothetical protein